MNISRATEQATFVLAMLGTQLDHTPLKSSVMSRVLGVSDSYLKKILRKMVLAGLIVSAAGKDGGFTLARPPQQITLAEISRVFDSPSPSTGVSKLAQRLFGDEDHVKKSINLFEKIEGSAFTAFFSELQKYTVADFLLPAALERGLIDWKERIHND